MNNRFLTLLRKYWVCMLLSIIMIAGTALSYVLDNIYRFDFGSGDGIFRFSLVVLWLFYILPIYSIAYGGLSYIITKKFWIPQLVLYLPALISALILVADDMIFNIQSIVLLQILVIPLYPVIFSIIGTLITALIYKAVKSIKNAPEQT